MSHRFSTISIGSNVSSDVSFGNASAVSGGSSCYLASMSSADFDDRGPPTLASSFSMSEADENEYLTAAAADQPPPQVSQTSLLPTFTSDFFPVADNIGIGNRNRGSGSPEHHFGTSLNFELSSTKTSSLQPTESEHSSKRVRV
jgi:hypothetical protein